MSDLLIVPIFVLLNLIFVYQYAIYSIMTQYEEHSDAHHKFTSHQWMTLLSALPDKTRQEIQQDELILF